MAGQRYRASIIIDLMGNIAQRSRQFSGSLSSMARSGQNSMRGLRTSVISVSNSIDRLGRSSLNTFKTLSAGALGVAGMGYTANKLFINIASTRENQRIALNSMYKGDKEHADKMMQWAIQNAKDSTWGLTGVMQEFTSSKAFGMSDDQTKNFITMLEDQGALKGWSLDSAQGASLQLKQMFSRQQITAADANLLTGYGINVYQILADRWGKDVKKVRAAGEKGNLGLKSIIDLFKALSEESKGAQKNAMNSWTGLTAQMGDVWEGFADKLMNKGPFERLKNQLSSVLKWYDRVSKPDASGLSELDRITDRLAKRFNTAFDTMQRYARQTWRVLQQGKKALSWVDENIVSLKTLGKVLGGIWLANKVGRAGVGVAKNVWGGLLRPAWKLTSLPFRMFRKRKRRGIPGTPDILSNPSLIQSVFVTNWPAGGFGGNAVTGGGKGKRKRGPGRGRGRSTRITPAPAAARAGLLSRMLGGTGKALSKLWPGRIVAKSAGVVGNVGRRLAGSPVGRVASTGLGAAGSAIGKVAAKGAGALSWMGKGAGRMFSTLGSGIGKAASKSLGAVSSAGSWLANSAVGKVAAKGAGALGWMGKSAGRVASKLGGPLMSAAMLAPVLLDDEATTQDKGSAIGGTAGAWIGGAIGSLAGPLGTVAGATLGGVAGDYLGGFVADLYTKWNEPKEQPQPVPQPPQEVNAQAALKVELADGLQITSSTVKEDGMKMNVFTGNNYMPVW